MGKYTWEVRRAVVEEEIIFPSECHFQNYLLQLAIREEPYTIVSERKENGRYIVVMRKRYGEYDFLGTPDQHIDSPVVELVKYAKQLKEE